MKQNESSEKKQTTGSQSSENSRILEAILFASDEVLSIAKIKSILDGQPDARKVRKMVDDINAKLQRERHPFEITEVAGGFQFRTIAYYHPWVRQLFKERSVKKLSLQALECLAIIAYKQPITKAEIEAIRGVVSDGAMKTLLERRLVSICGRSDKPGRPLLYATSSEFLQYFGINKIDDLPKIEEFEALAKEKMEELSEEEEQMIDELDDSPEIQENQHQPAKADTQEHPADSEQVTTKPQSDEPSLDVGQENRSVTVNDSSEEKNRSKPPESKAEDGAQSTGESNKQDTAEREGQKGDGSGDPEIADEYGEEELPVESMGGFDADDEYEEYEEEQSTAEESSFVDEDTSDLENRPAAPSDEQPDALTDDDLPSDMRDFASSEGAESED
ncbi:MAG: SMC-Scp complex subunit ScpB [Chitinivibrionales bacterium]